MEIEPNTPGLIEAIQKEEEEAAVFADFSRAFDSNGRSEEPLKWYDWDEDMRRISSKYPTHLFHLHGAGEENGDIWSATFKNGLMHLRKARVIIDPFDEGKLE